MQEPTDKDYKREVMGMVRGFLERWEGEPLPLDSGADTIGHFTISSPGDPPSSIILRFATPRTGFRYFELRIKAIQ